MAFPVTCPSCGKAFQLANEIYERKVAGKIVSIKCKQCQAGIRVDATQPGELKVVGATPPGGGDLSVGPKPPAAPSAQASAGGGQPKAEPAPMRMRQPTLIGMVSPAMGAAKAPAPAPKPAAPLLWAVDMGGAGDDRELNDDEMRREILAKRLTAQTLVWREGMAEWLELQKIPELARHLAGVRDDKTPQAAPAEERPKPVAAPAHASFQDEPDAEATRVYDRSAPNASLEPFAAPAPTPPAAPAAPGYRKTAPSAPGFGKTERMAPVAPGFGKTAPLAPAAPGLGKTAPLGAPPPPPLPAAGRPPIAAKTPAAATPEAPPAEAPAARPAPPPPPALPAAAWATAPAAELEPEPAEPEPEPARPAPPPPAPPAAPAFAPPPAAPAAPAFAAPPARPPVLAAVPWGDALPSAKPALPAAPAMPGAPYGPDPFALAAATDLDFPQPRSKKPLVIAAIVGVIAVIGIGIAIASSSSVPEANIAAPPPAPTTPSDTPKGPEPEKTSEPAARNDTSDPVAPAKQPDSSSGSFSDLFSKGAEKAKAPGSGDKAFDESKARAALSSVLDGAATCKEPGGPLGQSTATITFEPSGAVSGVTVGAPFAGTSTGTCLITAFKRAKIDAFAGLPRTVTQAISLR